jgi:hypothetical protein
VFNVSALSILQRDMKRPLIALMTVGSLMTANAKAGVLTLNDLSPEEQALLSKGAFVEMHEPSMHSGHEIGSIQGQGSKKWDTVLMLIFGKEDIAVARAEGRNMREAHYTSKMAYDFLFAEGWDKFHDRYFTRAYVQEGLDGFNGRE